MSDGVVGEAGKLMQEALKRKLPDLYGLKPSDIGINLSAAERPSWDDTFMTLAATWAKRSTCPRLSVGCVLVDTDHHVVASGYNGAPRGRDHCSDIGCRIEGEGKHAHCINAMHAEANAIAQAARTGVSIKGCYLYTTHLPCARCANLLLQAGVVGCVFDHAIPMWRETERTLNLRQVVTSGFWFKDQLVPNAETFKLRRYNHDYMWSSEEDGPGE